jgi:hypothetical protein
MDSLNLEALPEAFSIRNENGGYTQIKDPCYHLLAPGFYGKRNNGTWYDEGEMLIYDGVPNYHLQPLNRAAGVKMQTWLDTLPTSGVSINIDDLSEAATMIANREELGKMSKKQIAEATQKIAVELKKKRDGTSGMTLPPIGGDTIFTAGQAQGKPPAMPATRYLDPSLRGPGHVGERGVIHEPKLGPSEAKRAAQFAAAPVSSGA